MLPLGEAEGEYAALLEHASHFDLEGFVGAHPDRAEAEDGDLPGVPVVQAVEAEDLVELAVAPGVPAGRPSTELEGATGASRRSLRLEEGQEVLVPDAILIVLLDLLEPFAFEESHRVTHDGGRSLPRGTCG